MRLFQRALQELHVTPQRIQPLLRRTLRLLEEILDIADAALRNRIRIPSLALHYALRTTKGSVLRPETAKESIGEGKSLFFMRGDSII